MKSEHTISETSILVDLGISYQVFVLYNYKGVTLFWLYLTRFRVLTEIKQ